MSGKYDLESRRQKYSSTSSGTFRRLDPSFSVDLEPPFLDNTDHLSNGRGNNRSSEPFKYNERAVDVTFPATKYPTKDSLSSSLAPDGSSHDKTWKRTKKNGDTKISHSVKVNSKETDFSRPVTDITSDQFKFIDSKTTEVKTRADEKKHVGLLERLTRSWRKQEHDSPQEKKRKKNNSRADDTNSSSSSSDDVRGNKKNEKEMFEIKFPNNGSKTSLESKHSDHVTEVTSSGYENVTTTVPNCFNVTSETIPEDYENVHVTVSAGINADEMFPEISPNDFKETEPEPDYFQSSEISDNYFNTTDLFSDYFNNNEITQDYSYADEPTPDYFKGDEMAPDDFNADELTPEYFTANAITFCKKDNKLSSNSNHTTDFPGSVSGDYENAALLVNEIKAASTEHVNGKKTSNDIEDVLFDSQNTNEDVQNDSNADFGVIPYNFQSFNEVIPIDSYKDVNNQPQINDQVKRWGTLINIDAKNQYDDNPELTDERSFDTSDSDDEEPTKCDSESDQSDIVVDVLETCDNQGSIQDEGLQFETNFETIKPCERNVFVPDHQTLSDCQDKLLTFNTQTICHTEQFFYVPGNQTFSTEDNIVVFDSNAIHHSEEYFYITGNQKVTHINVEVLDPNQRKEDLIKPEILVPEYDKDDNVKHEILVLEHDKDDNVKHEILVPEHDKDDNVKHEILVLEHDKDDNVKHEILVPEHDKDDNVKPEILVPKHDKDDNVKPEILVPEQEKDEFLVPDDQTQHKTNYSRSSSSSSSSSSNSPQISRKLMSTFSPGGANLGNKQLEPVQQRHEDSAVGCCHVIQDEQVFSESNSIQVRASYQNINHDVHGSTPDEWSEAASKEHITVCTHVLSPPPHMESAGQDGEGLMEQLTLIIDHGIGGSGGMGLESGKSEDLAPEISFKSEPTEPSCHVIQDRESGEVVECPVLSPSPETIEFVDYDKNREDSGLHGTLVSLQHIVSNDPSVSVQSETPGSPIKVQVPSPIKAEDPVNHEAESGYVHMKHDGKLIHLLNPRKFLSKFKKLPTKSSTSGKSKKELPKTFLGMTGRMNTTEDYITVNSVPEPEPERKNIDVFTVVYQPCSAEIVYVPKLNVSVTLTDNAEEIPHHPLTAAGKDTSMNEVKPPDNDGISDKVHLETDEALSLATTVNKNDLDPADKEMKESSRVLSVKEILVLDLPESSVNHHAKNSSSSSDDSSSGDEEEPIKNITLTSLQTNQKVLDTAPNSVREIKADLTLHEAIPSAELTLHEAIPSAELTLHEAIPSAELTLHEAIPSAEETNNDDTFLEEVETHLTKAIPEFDQHRGKEFIHNGSPEDGPTDSHEDNKEDFTIVSNVSTLSAPENICQTQAQKFSQKSASVSSSSSSSSGDEEDIGQTNHQPVSPKNASLTVSSKSSSEAEDVEISHTYDLIEVVEVVKPEVHEEVSDVENVVAVHDQALNPDHVNLLQDHVNLLQDQVNLHQDQVNLLQDQVTLHKDKDIGQEIQKSNSDPTKSHEISTTMATEEYQNKIDQSESPQTEQMVATINNDSTKIDQPNSAKKVDSPETDLPKKKHKFFSWPFKRNKKKHEDMKCSDANFSDECDVEAGFTLVHSDQTEKSNSDFLEEETALNEEFTNLSTATQASTPQKVKEHKVEIQVKVSDEVSPAPSDTSVNSGKSSRSTSVSSCSSKGSTAGHRDPLVEQSIQTKSEDSGIVAPETSSVHVSTQNDRNESFFNESPSTLSGEENVKTQQTKDTKQSKDKNKSSTKRKKEPPSDKPSKGKNLKLTRLLSKGKGESSSSSSSSEDNRESSRQHSSQTQSSEDKLGEERSDVEARLETKTNISTESASPKSQKGSKISKYLPMLRSPTKKEAGVNFDNLLANDQRFDGQYHREDDVTQGLADDQSKSPSLKSVSKQEQDEAPKTFPSVTSEPRHFVVVAIDVGTTHSGYAFSFVRDPGCVYMMRRWAGEEPGLVNQKTLTSLLLTPEGKFHSFGYNARSSYLNLIPMEAKHWMYFSTFKMELHHNTELSLDTKLVAVNGATYPAVKVFAYCLEFFKTHALQQLSDQSSMDILNEDIRWVITVPAIWKAPAKQFMRQAAYEAGLASENYPEQLLIALEPEAASIYCRTLRIHQLVPDHPLKRTLQSPSRSNVELNNVEMAVTELSVGSRYLIVDCGGGTVDITVHELDPSGHIKELHQATGGPHGSIGIDAEFEKLLGGIFGADFIEHYKRKYPMGWVHLMTDFESRKRSTSPLKTTFLNVSLPFTFISDFKKHKTDPEVAVKRYGDPEVEWSPQGMLRLSPVAMKQLFLPTLTHIKQAIGDVLNHPNARDVKYMFLVGGFSESPLLQHEMRQEFGTIMKLLIPQEVSLAILKGAVLFGLDPSIVNVRRSRLTYGVGILNKFDPSRHPKSKLVTRSGLAWCTDIFDKYVETDQPVLLGTSVVRSYAPANCGQSSIVLNIYSSQDPNVQFITDPGVARCGTLSLTLPSLEDADTSQLPRAIEAQMSFGDTEISVIATDVTTGKMVKAAVDFLGT